MNTYLLTNRTWSTLPVSKQWMSKRARYISFLFSFSVFIDCVMF